MERERDGGGCVCIVQRGGVVTMEPATKQNSHQTTPLLGIHRSILARKTITASTYISLHNATSYKAIPVFLLAVVAGPPKQLLDLQMASGTFQ